MARTSRYNLPYPEGQDRVAVHSDIEELARATDASIPVVPELPDNIATKEELSEAIGTRAPREHGHNASNINEGVLSENRLPEATSEKRGAISAEDQRRLDEASARGGEENAEKLARYSSSGNLRTGWAQEDDEAIPKGYFDDTFPPDHRALLTNATSVPRPNDLARRDGVGRIEVSAPEKPTDASNKYYVDHKEFAWKQIIELARRDGWSAVYDPSNPNSVTFNSQGNVTSIKDGLGNFPDLESTHTAPKFVPNEYGQLSAVRDGTLFANFSDNHQFPITLLNIAKNEGGRTGTRYLVAGNTGTRAEIAARAGAWQYSQGLWKSRGSVDRRPHVFESFFNQRSSRFTIDGQHVTRGLTGGSNTFGSLRLGGFATSNTWEGTYGACLIYLGEAPQEVLNRMRNLILSLTKIQFLPPELNSETRVLSLDGQDRTVFCKGDPDVILNDSIASMTKMITALCVRHYLPESELDNRITVQAEDQFWPDRWDRFGAGDQVSWRHALEAMAKVSDNDIAGTFARNVYSRFLSNKYPTFTPYQGFLQELDTLLNEQWDCKGAIVRQATGGGRLSTRHVAKIMRRVLNDPILRQIFGPGTVELDVTGPNARKISITHGEDIHMPPWIAKKTGGGGSRSHVCIAWPHPDGSEHITVIQDVLTASLRDGDPRETEFYKTRDCVLSGEIYTDRADSFLSGDRVEATQRRDITELVPNVTKISDANNAGVFISRTDDTVMLSVRGVRVQNRNFAFSLPSGFRPAQQAPGSLWVVSGGFAPLFCRADPEGAFLTNNVSGNDFELAGSIVWLAPPRNNHTFPQPPYPGKPSQTVHGSYYVHF